MLTSLPTPDTPDEIETQLWTVRADQAERLTLYQSRSEALEAAGLRE